MYELPKTLLLFYIITLIWFSVASRVQGRGIHSIKKKEIHVQKISWLMSCVKENFVWNLLISKFILQV